MARGARGLFVGSSLALLEAYRLALDRGVEAVLLPTAGEAAAVISMLNPRFLVADYMLPDGDGLDLYNRVRLTASVPMLVIAPSQGSWIESVGHHEEGLSVVGEASARAAVERFMTHIGAVGAEEALEVGGLELDLGRRLLKWKGTCSRLTPKQAAVMGGLMRQWGQVVLRRDLTYALDVAGRRMERSVDYHIARLRRQLESMGCSEWTIESVYGLGYRLRLGSGEVGHGA